MSDGAAILCIVLMFGGLYVFFLWGYAVYYYAFPEAKLKGCVWMVVGMLMMLLGMAPALFITP